MATTYDAGDPDSILCRWCKAARLIVRGARLCAKCDVRDVDDVPATWQVIR